MLIAIHQILGMTPLALLLFAGAVGAVLLLTIQRTKAARHLKDLQSENATLRAAMEKDTLTSAQSRNHFFAEIEDSPRTETKALLFLDLDDFKTVNYGHGHAIGDALLTAIVKSLMDAVGTSGIVARIGGDELCVLLHTDDPDTAMATAKKICDVVAATHVPSKGQSVSRSTSIGVHMLRPEQRLVDAILIADDALARAKKDGRNRVQLADEDILDSRARLAARPTIEELQTGLDENQISYYVQPIWNIKTGKPVGVEALIRWITPSGEIRLPDDFMDTMTSGYHLELKPPLEAANRAANAFTKNNPDMFCTFNISSKFLEQSHDLGPGWINDLLHGVPPDQMVFEIVESAVINDPEGAQRLFAALRKAGVRVALDDFGTGLSNLERLHNYPIDIVKVDKQFVSELGRNPRNAGILKGLVEMSRTLGFEIIAEGVETEEQLAQIEEIGISLVQGFLLGRPAQVDEWLKRLG